ncbi:SDR family oxidoreductase [Nocardiopsis ansamitocini]|nr:NAD(P)H-binding protein [Nocardiopsis ansamitocini]
MRFTVIGGTGLIGAQVVGKLAADGHNAVAASRSTGVDVLTGQGLEQALSGADVVINLTNSPTFDAASVEFFTASTNTLTAACRTAGVSHHVLLSIVGVDRLPQLDYYRAKTAQEDILAAGPTPYSIVRATQFFEFVDTILSWTTDDGTVRLPTTRLQPIAAADVADAIATTATGIPWQGTRDIAGPDLFPLDELGRITLAAHPDGRTVVTDDRAGMFAAIAGDVLTAGREAILAPTHYADWIQRL